MLMYLDIPISSTCDKVAVNIVDHHAVDGGSVDWDAVEEGELSNVKHTHFSLLPSTEESLLRV